MVQNSHSHMGKAVLMSEYFLRSSVLQLCEEVTSEHTLVFAVQW